MLTPRQFTIFVDGQCPLCRREGELLRWLDRGRGLLRVEDISDPLFDAESLGLRQSDLLAEIHGLTAEGRIVRGMEVFRRAYAAVGLGWLLAPTGWPGLRKPFDAAYRWFARNRYRLAALGNGCVAGRCRHGHSPTGNPVGEP